jgi:phospholipid N-methyltransferase
MQERFGGFERLGPVMRNVPPAFVLRYWSAR